MPKKSSFKPIDNKEMAEAFRELRKGSRCSPVPSGKVYKRKPKHGSWS